MLLHGKIKAQQNSITFQNGWMDITQVWSLFCGSVLTKRITAYLMGYYFSQGTQRHPKRRVLIKKSQGSERPGVFRKRSGRNTRTLMVPLSWMASLPSASTGPGLHQEPRCRTRQWQEPARSRLSTNFKRHTGKTSFKVARCIVWFKAFFQ